MGMGDAKSERKAVGYLDALRKAFRRSVQENKIAAAEWGEHAEQFLEKQKASARNPS